MADPINEFSGIKLPVVGLLALISTSFTMGGSAVGAWLSIQNGERAINVAVQHGAELDQLRGRISRLETDLVRRAAERWTRSDQARREAEIERTTLAAERRIGALERIVDKQHSK